MARDNRDPHRVSDGKAAPLLPTLVRHVVGSNRKVNPISERDEEATTRNPGVKSNGFSEELNWSVLTSLQDHLVVLDQNGKIVAVNDAWTRFDLHGEVPPSMGGGGAGGSYPQVCPQATASGDTTVRRAQDGINSVLSRQSPFFSMEYSCHSPSESGWFLMRVLPLKRAEGGVVISHTNITQRKEAELELVRQRSELAHFSRVALLGQLSGSLAHELNQPLAAILSNAQAALRFLADENYDRDEMREILSDIVSDDKRAGDVIQGLRLLLKKGETRHEDLDMNELVRDVFKLMRSDILNARVDVTMTLAASLPTVTGDRVQLQQVLLNLVMNGCDAMAGVPAPQRRLVIATEHVTVDEIRVRVIDRGPGIPPGDLGRVFEPFYTTKAKGLGLGLVVSRKIIAAHGGYLCAENNAGGGAVFCLALPAGPRGTA